MIYKFEYNTGFELKFFTEEQAKEYAESDSRITNWYLDKEAIAEYMKALPLEERDNLIDSSKNVLDLRPILSYNKRQKELEDEYRK